MTILIVGASDEAHAALIQSKLHARGASTCYLDTRRFPQTLRVSLYPADPSANNHLTDSETGQCTALDDISAVYWRYHMGIHPPQLPDAFVREMAAREIESTLGSLMRMLDCDWFNSPDAIAMHAYKPYQLQQLARHGIRVPQTLISNDPQAVQDFYARQNGRVIYKPVRGGAHTAALTPPDLTPARLADLAHAPVQFQERIDGVDIRAYLIGDEVFAAEIQSQTLDFRDDPSAPIIPVRLPSDIEAACRQVGQLLGLRYSGIDLRRTEAGEYVFLEGNPAPMFIHFEQRTGYPISDRLTDHLCAALPC